MRFQNVKASELEGPIKLVGFSEWSRAVEGPNVESVLLASIPGAGKGAAVGLLAESLNYDIMRCRLSQLLDYQNPTDELRAMLKGTERLHKTLVWLDGVDRFLSSLSDPAPAAKALEDWLKNQGPSFKINELMIVGTAHTVQGIPDQVTGAFQRTFVS